MEHKNKPHRYPPRSPNAPSPQIKQCLDCGTIATKRAEGIYLPNLVVASHGVDCPNRLTPEAERILHNMLEYLEDPQATQDEATHEALRITAAITDLNDSCPDCQYDTEFSSDRCELCGGLPGTRFTVAQIFPGTNEEPVYYAACADCLLCIANGEGGIDHV